MLSLRESTDAAAKQLAQLQSERMELQALQASQKVRGGGLYKKLRFHSIFFSLPPLVELAIKRVGNTDATGYFNGGGSRAAAIAVGSRQRELAPHGYCKGNNNILFFSI